MTHRAQPHRGPDSRRGYTAVSPRIGLDPTSSPSCYRETSTRIPEVRCSIFHITRDTTPWADPEVVNDFETPTWGIQCGASVNVAGAGGLIHAAVGGASGAGGLRTNRSGWAA
jgi:hypothetical protein